MLFPIDKVIFINAAIIVLFIWALIYGYKKGFLILLLGLLGTIVSLFIAYLFSAPVAERFPLFALQQVVSTNQTIQDFFANRFNQLIWFFIIFIFLKIFTMVLRPIIRAITTIPGVKQLNSLGGLISSVFLYYLQLLLVCFLLTFPLIKNGNEVISESWLNPIQASSTAVFAVIRQPFEDNIVIQKILSGQTLTTTDLAQLQSLLEKAGVGARDITEYIDNLR